jgi:hypothetical protein
MTATDIPQPATFAQPGPPPATDPGAIHFAVASTVFDGRQAREYRAFDADARPLFIARALRAPGTIHIFDSAADNSPRTTMKPRWTFPFTGKYDIRRASDGSLIGIARRNGWLSDTDGRKLARFTDARSLKGLVGESVVEAVFEVALGGDGSAHAGPGSGSFILLIGGAPVGLFCRERLPFMVDPPAPVPTSGWRKWMRTVLPKCWFKARPPRGWKLRLDPESKAIDRDLLIAQALLTAEISAW